MLKNRLKMNDSKTEMMVLAFSRVKLPTLSTAVGAESHQPAGQVINFGLILDVHLTMEPPIKQVCQISYFQLNTIQTVKRFC